MASCTGLFLKLQLWNAILIANLNIAVQQSVIHGCGPGESWFSCKPLEFIYDHGTSYGRPFSNQSGVASDAVCTPGCGCIDGYVRQYRPFYRCVPLDTLLKLHEIATCKFQEEHRECGSCDPQCYDMTPPCPHICRPGCYCKPGFVRDPNGKCILINECRSPGYVCSRNETWSPCSNPVCQPSCATRRTATSECTAHMCVPGCVCRTGFIRASDDPEDECIPLADCRIRPACGENERFASCMGCSRVCDPDHLDEPIVCPMLCLPGCECLPGFYRDPSRNGACVSGLICSGLKREQRNPNELIQRFPRADECSPNRMWRSCGSLCQVVCEGGLLANESCQDASECIPGCYCRPGLIKDSETWECLKLSECLSRFDSADSDKSSLEINNITTLSPQSVFENGTENEIESPIKTQDVDSHTEMERPLKNVTNNDGQSTNKNMTAKYIYPISITLTNASNNSIRIINSEKQETKFFVRGNSIDSCTENQTFSECRTPCPENCQKLAQNCAFLACQSGCECAKGYIWNEAGRCVAREDCPVHLAYDEIPSCPPNMAFSECGNINRPSCTPLPTSMGQFVCEWGCFCMSGYWIDGKGGCVKKEECGKTMEGDHPDSFKFPIISTPSIHIHPILAPIPSSASGCPANSEWHDCISPCQKWCRGKWHQHNDCFSPCISGCVCCAGFVRGADGGCVPEQSCSAFDLALSAKEELHTLAEGLKYCMKKTDRFPHYCRSLRLKYDTRQFCYWDNYAKSCSLTCCLINL